MLKLFTVVKLTIAEWLDNEEGQGLTEYGLILAFIAIVAIGALTFLGGSVKTVLSNVATSVA